MPSSASQSRPVKGEPRYPTIPGDHAMVEEDGSITLLDAATWASVLEWKAHAGRVTALEWSADGLRLASADDKAGLVRVWNARTGVQSGASLSTSSKVRRLVWSPDGTRLGMEEGPGLQGSEWQPWVEIHHVGSATLEELHTSAASIAWSPDGTRYAVGGLHEVRVHAAAMHALEARWSATPATVELELTGSLTCDWRPGDVW